MIDKTPSTMNGRRFFFSSRTMIDQSVRASKIPIWMPQKMRNAFTLKAKSPSPKIRYVAHVNHLLNGILQPTQHWAGVFERGSSELTDVHRAFIELCTSSDRPPSATFANDGRYRVPEL
ncbi:hypothetical protein A3B20_03165 [Candidatus Uhrbacteria bacterium RIFCSPLOWO2_01_FULL_47_17]|nr:MAG: hypothetical protein A3B20_03165 [Candidatus Uhrbacteria bacterium RIFCSPLOWO2_01_FULL_47_17]